MAEVTVTKTYAEMVQSIAAIEQMGKWIAMSGMFGTKLLDQACVIAMDLYITNLPVREYIKRNSLVMGRPSIPYDAQLAAFRERGGKSKMLSKTADLASIELSLDGMTQTFSLSWEEAQRETFPYDGKENEILELLAAGKQPKLKAKYATPRSRAIMLFARLVSDSIRTMCPEVNFGSYTPEEIEDIPTAVTQRSEAPAVTTYSNSTGGLTKNPAVASSATVTPSQPVAQETANQFSVSLNDPLLPDHKVKLLNQMKFLAQNGIPDIKDRVKAALLKNKLELLDDLTIGEGDRLMKALELREIETWATETLKGHKSFQ